jgi:hypothetical protein
LGSHGDSLPEVWRLSTSATKSGRFLIAHPRLIL